MATAPITAGRRSLAGLALLALAASGCAGSGNKDDAFQARPVSQLYNAAHDKLAAGLYKEAAQRFEEVDRQHPYSRWARRAQLMAGYAYYRGRNYTDAVLALERYTELYPGSPNADYARYLRARCFYERISVVTRDQKMTERAHQALQTVVDRHGASIYAQDARAKLALTRNHKAGQHMAVGRYHQGKDYQGPAIRRFNRVLGQFETTPQIPEALYRLTESYLALGLDKAAYRHAAVLGHNYPGSRWYDKAYAKLDSLGLVDDPPAKLGKPRRGPAIARPQDAPGPGQGLQDIPAPRPPEYKSRAKPKQKQQQEDESEGPSDLTRNRTPGPGGLP